MRKLLVAVLLLGGSFVHAQRTIIYCGKLIDVVNGKVLNNYTVIIDGNKIVDVKEGFVKAEGNDKVIDLKNKTVMPGLMDMHVHIESETKKSATADRFIMNPADIAFES